jgi:hypothetical protein
MVAFDSLQYPVLEVSIGGAVVDKRPSRFMLTTVQGFPAVMANLVYPADTIISSIGDSVIISLVENRDKNILFVGDIYDVKTRGAYYDLSLTDGYKKLHDTMVVNAYRKETAKGILQDTLDAAGITDTSITCPAITLARFSTDSITADMSIDLLIRAMEQHGIQDLRFFFDAKNVFHFGISEDTGKNEGIEIALETGKNIIRRGEGFVETLPLPLRHSQSLTIDGTAVETIRTELVVSQRRSRLVAWVKGI